MIYKPEKILGIWEIKNTVEPRFTGFVGQHTFVPKIGVSLKSGFSTYEVNIILLVVKIENLSFAVILIDSIFKFSFISGRFTAKTLFFGS